MTEKPAIISLNISNNNITDKSCSTIKEMLLYCYTIREFYIRGNNITRVGGALILDGI